MKLVLASVLRTCRSVRFNIGLGAAIALSCAIGTFLPQVSETPEKAAAWQAAHPNWAKLFDFFGFFDLYFSWWFMGMLALMAVDIVLCKLWKTPADAGLVALPPEATREEEAERHVAQKSEALRLKPCQASLTSPLPHAEAAALARAALRRAGYHLRLEFELAQGSAFVATRHRLQRWGSYLAHIALVVILCGALVKGVWGFVEMVPVLEGRSRAMQHKPDWEVFVDKFTVRYYDGTQVPSHFSSVMRVEKGGAVLGEKTIVVNDPLDIGGVRFYQATWGAGGMFRSATLEIGGKEVVLAQRAPTKLLGSPFTVEADMMLPNFTVVNGQAQTASLDLKNPAVRFVFTVGPHRTRPLWLFLHNPGLCFAEDEQGTLTHAPEPPFRLKKIDPILFSGIQVAYDPGFPLVVAGSLLWLIGTVSLFYLHRRRLWILAEPAAGGSRLTVGGWSSRGARAYAGEFERLMERLSERLGGRDLHVRTDSPLEVVR